MTLVFMQGSSNKLERPAKKCTPKTNRKLHGQSEFNRGFTFSTFHRSNRRGSSLKFKKLNKSLPESANKLTSQKNKQQKRTKDKYHTKLA